MVQIGPEVHVQMESCRFFFRLTNRFSRAQIELCARKTKQNQTATKYEKHTRWCTDHVQERDEAARKNEELFNLMLFRVVFNPCQEFRENLNADAILKA